MSSINSLMNAGSASVTGNAVANNAINKISEKISDIESDTTRTDEYKQKQIDKLSSQLSTAANVQANIANASSLINGMLGKTDTVDFSYFFGSGDLSTIRTLMNANMQTQKEARVLASEISLDKMRGCDTSDKEERLSNMSANMSISNNTLNSQINNVLADDKTDKDTRSVIDKIKDSLAAEQKKLDKEFGHTTEDDKTTDDKKTDTSTATTTESAAKTKEQEEYDRIHKPSVIDQIKSGLEENQKKLDEEFNGKA